MDPGLESGNIGEHSPVVHRGFACRFHPESDLTGVGHGRQVYAVAYDNPIPGWKTENAINLRLWAGEPVEEFDLASFNVGEYTESRAATNTAATISAVLYPEDSTPAGKMLRLKQQFFFTSASLQVTPHPAFDRRLLTPNALVRAAHLSALQLGREEPGR